MARRNKNPPLTLNQLEAGEVYYSKEERAAILDSFKIRDDFEPTTYEAPFVFTPDFPGRLEALAHIYACAGRASPPSRRH